MEGIVESVEALVDWALVEGILERWGTQWQVGEHVRRVATAVDFARLSSLSLSR